MSHAFKLLSVGTIMASMLMVAAAAECQTVRVLVITPAQGAAIPEDAMRVFKRAIVESMPGVVFVSSVADATDLIEFTGYGWEPDSQLGVVQSWRFCHQPLEKVCERCPARVKPFGYQIGVPGRTLLESTQASAESLRDAIGRLLQGFEPALPK